MMEANKGKDVKRLRFGPDDDLALLREVIGQNPLEDPEKWENVRRNILEITGKNFSVRTLKDHLFLILEIWIQKDSGNQKKSGIEEIYSERDHLLQELSDICNRTNTNYKQNKRKRSLSKEKQIMELGKKAREQCALDLVPKNNSNVASTSKDLISDHNYFLEETFPPCVEEPEITLHLDIVNPEKESTKENKEVSKETEEKFEPKKRILGPSRTRHNKSSNVRKSALEYLQKKEESSNMWRKRELDLEEKRLHLEEKRLALEERRQNNLETSNKEQLIMEKERFRQEIMERDKIYKLIEQQQKLIDSLLKSTTENI